MKAPAWSSDRGRPSSSAAIAATRCDQRRLDPAESRDPADRFVSAADEPVGRNELVEVNRRGEDGSHGPGARGQQNASAHVAGKNSGTDRGRRRYPAPKASRRFARATPSRRRQPRACRVLPGQEDAKGVRWRRSRRPRFPASRHLPRMLHGSLAGADRRIRPPLEFYPRLAARPAQALARLECSVDEGQSIVTRGKQDRARELSKAMVSQSVSWPGKLASRQGTEAARRVWHGGRRSDQALLEGPAEHRSHRGRRGRYNSNGRSGDRDRKGRFAREGTFAYRVNPAANAASISSSHQTDLK